MMVKPTLITLLSTLCTLSSFSQDSSTVTIHYPPGLHAQSIYIDYMDGDYSSRKQLDSANVVFKQRRSWRYADIVIYYPDTTYQRKFILNTFWVGNEPADIYVIPDSNGNRHFLRYQLKNAFNVADSGLTRLNLYKKSTEDAISAAIASQQKAYSEIVDKRIDSLYLQTTYKNLTFIRSLKPSYFRLWMFRTKLAVNHLLPVDTLLATYHSLFPEENIQKSSEGKFIEETITRRTHTKIGATAPDYNLHTSTGQSITSQNTRGKYVLLDFWASWCGPCVREIPKLAALHEKYDTSKFLVISITLDDNKNDFQTAADNLHMTWPLIFGNTEIVKNYEVGPIPTLYLMDPQGKIIYKSLDIGEQGLVANDDEQLTKLNNLLANVNAIQLSTPQ